MKLFVWQPHGHGQFSFFVCADDENTARKAVEIEIHRRRQIEFGVDRFTDYESEGWGTEYYELTVLDPGQVAVNPND